MNPHALTNCEPCCCMVWLVSDDEGCAYWHLRPGKFSYLRQACRASYRCLDEPCKRLLSHMTLNEVDCDQIMKIGIDRDATWIIYTYVRAQPRVYLADGCYCCVVCV